MYSQWARYEESKVIRLQPVMRHADITSCLQSEVQHSQIGS